MNKLKPVIGEKFGCYEVISNEVHMIKDKNRDHYRGHYLVKCKCGREVYIRSDILKKGEATKCRYCSNKEKYDRLVEDNRIDKKGYSQGHQGIGKLPKTLVGSIKIGAKNRGIEWKSEDMTPEYLWNIFQKQEGKCALSGIEIKLFEKGEIILTPQRNLDWSKFTASLDRIDSSKGYIKGNVQWVHRHVNIMKNEYSTDYFIKLCKLITDKNGK